MPRQDKAPSRGRFVATLPRTNGPRFGMTLYFQLWPRISRMNIMITTDKMYTHGRIPGSPGAQTPTHGISSSAQRMEEITQDHQSSAVGVREQRLQPLAIVLRSHLRHSKPQSPECRCFAKMRIGNKQRFFLRPVNRRIWTQHQPLTGPIYCECPAHFVAADSSSTTIRRTRSAHFSEVT